MYFQNCWHLDMFAVVKKQFLRSLFLLNSITDFGRQLGEHLTSRGSRKKMAWFINQGLIRILRVRKVINWNPVPSWHRLVFLSLPFFLLLPAPVPPPFSFWHLPFSFHFPIALPFPPQFPLLSPWISSTLSSCFSFLSFYLSTFLASFRWTLLIFLLLQNCCPGKVLHPEQRDSVPFGVELCWPGDLRPLDLGSWRFSWRAAWTGSSGTENWHCNGASGFDSPKLAKYVKKIKTQLGIYEN